MKEAFRVIIYLWLSDPHLLTSTLFSPVILSLSIFCYDFTSLFTTCLGRTTLPLLLALSFLVCLPYVSPLCARMQPCCPSTISLGCSSVRVNKPPWFHQRESLSLIRRDPDGIFSSFYTSIHHLSKPQSHMSAGVRDITCQSEGRVSHKLAGHIIEYTFSLWLGMCCLLF